MDDDPTPPKQPTAGTPRASNSRAEAEAAVRLGMQRAAAGLWKGANDAFFDASMKFTGSFTDYNRAEWNLLEQRTSVADCLSSIAMDLQVIGSISNEKLKTYKYVAICSAADLGDPDVVNLQNMRSAARDRKLREGAIDDILNARARNNAGLNDNGQSVAPIAPPPVATTHPNAPPTRTQQGNLAPSRPSSPSGNVDRDGSGTDATTPATGAECGLTDVWPNLGRCVAKKATNLRERAQKYIDENTNNVIDADRVFPRNSGKNDPF